MFKVTGIDHLVLRSNNIEKMVNFYVNILGFSIEKINEDIGITHFRMGDHLLDLLKVTEKPSKEKNLEHFCLRILPFDYESLKHYFQQHNIELLRYGKRYSAQGMGDSFYIKDPDGNEIEFIESKKHPIE